MELDLEVILSLNQTPRQSFHDPIQSVPFLLYPFAGSRSARALTSLSRLFEIVHVPQANQLEKLQSPVSF